MMLGRYGFAAIQGCLLAAVAACGSSGSDDGSGAAGAAGAATVIPEHVTNEQKDHSTAEAPSWRRCCCSLRHASPSATS